MRVVEVVEGVEEPVLERELPENPCLAHDVRIHHRLAAPGEALRPAVVVTAWTERIAREVQVVLETVDEVVGGRTRS